MAAADTPAGLHLLSTVSHADALPTNWSQLQRLTCVRNGFTLMDSSLTLCPELRDLDLSHNNIREVDNLHVCTALTRLVLNHNHIGAIKALPAAVSRLRELSLQVKPLLLFRGCQTSNFKPCAL